MRKLLKNFKSSTFTCKIKENLQNEENPSFYPTGYLWKWHVAMPGKGLVTAPNTAVLNMVHRALRSQRLLLGPVRQQYFHNNTEILFTFFTVGICTDDAQPMVWQSEKYALSKGLLLSGMWGLSLGKMQLFELSGKVAPSFMGTLVVLKRID